MAIPAWAGTGGVSACAVENQVAGHDDAIGQCDFAGFPAFNSAVVVQRKPVGVVCQIQQGRGQIRVDDVRTKGRVCDLIRAENFDNRVGPPVSLIVNQTKFVQRLTHMCNTWPCAQIGQGFQTKRHKRC